MPNLILVPTRFEYDLVRDSLLSRLNDWTCELCGFGMVAAAAAASRSIQRNQPQKLILMGIAGTYEPEQCPIATATCFEQVICDGIGVGNGDQFCSAQQMGWNQWESDSLGTPRGDKPRGDKPFGDTPIGDTIDLHTSEASGIPALGALVSVCAASANIAEAAARHKRYPSARAEDMEGFAVALAARLASVPLQVVRGISNVAGDRNLDHWKTQEAMAAACELAIQIAKDPW